MSFGAPLVLLALVASRLLVGGYVAPAARPRAAPRPRSPRRALPAVGRAAPARLAPPRADARLRARARRAGRRRRQAADDGRGPGRARVDHARRPTSRARCRPPTSQPNRLVAARRAAKQLRRQRARAASTSASWRSTRRRACCSRPTHRPRRHRAALDRLAPSGGTATGDGDRRRRCAILRQRARRSTASAPPAAIVLLSDGASTKRRRPGRRRAGRAQAARSPSTRSRSAPPSGTIKVPRPGGQRGTETRRVPPDPRVAARRSRRPPAASPSPPTTRRRLKRRLRAARLPARAQERKRQITAGFAGGGARAAAARRRPVPALVRPPDLSRLTHEHESTDMTDHDDPHHPARRDPRGALEEALHEIKRVIVGQDAMLERLLVALLAGGHVLLEGVPGLAKTLTVKTLAQVLGGTFRRIQFTPDLVPADLVGTRVYRPDTGRFDTELGPVFGNFLLADEINRAPAKVQSALLEVMQEHQVTIGGTDLPGPAPVPRHGDAEPDRVRGHLPAARGAGRPLPDEDRRRLPDASARRPPSSAAASASRPTCASACRSTTSSATPAAAARVLVDRDVIGYAVALADATRNPRELRPRRPRRATSSTAPARAGRSASSTRRARWRCCAAAGTSTAGDVRDLARRRPAPPARAVLRRAQRGRHRRRRARARPRRRCPSPTSDHLAPARGRARREPGRRPGAARAGPAAAARARARCRRALVDALDLVVARRAAGALPGDRRAAGVGRGHRARAAAPVRGRRRRAPDRRRRRPRAPASPHVRLHVPERTLTTWLVLDVVAVDGVRHRRPPEGRRRRGRRARARPPGRAPRRARRAGDLRRGPRRACCRRAGRGRRSSRCAARWPRASASDGHADPRALGARAGPRRRASPRQPGLRRRHLRLPRPGRLDAPARRACARATRCSPSRSATRARASCPPSGAWRCRPRDRRAHRGRHLPPARARALRRRSSAERARRDRARAAPPAGRPRRPVDRRRLAAGAGQEAAVTPPVDPFASPPWLLALLLVPLADRRLRAQPRGGRRRYAVRFTGGRRRCSWRPARRPRGGATCRPRSRSPRSPRSCSRWPSPSSTSRCPIERASIMLVTDHSRSMQATDVAPDRLAAAQRAARTFLRRLPGPRARRRRRLLRRARRRPGADHRPRAPRARIIDGQIADGATATGDALQVAIDAPDRSDRKNGKRPPAAIVLLSDGKTTDRPRPGRGRPRGRRARRSRSTRSRSAPTTPPCPTRSRSARRCSVAARPRDAQARSPQASGGSAFTAEDDEQLSSIYQSLGLAAGHQEAAQAGDRRVRDRRPAAAARRRAASVRFSGRLP